MIRVHCGKTRVCCVQYIRLIRLYLKEIIATMLLQCFQERTLGKDCIARKQTQHRIEGEQLIQMRFETTRLVGFISADVVTHQGNFDIMNENIEHLDRIAVGISHLFGNFAVHGGGERTFFGENDFQKFGNGFVKIVDGRFGEGAEERGIDGWLFAFEFQGFFENVPLSFCPSSDFGDGGQLGEESEEYEGEHTVIGVGDSLFGSRIGQGFEGVGEEL